MADELTNILGKRAAFAATFGGTTNLAQRRRYQEDISQYEDAKANEDQRQFDVLNRQAEQANPLKARTVRVAEGRLRSDQEKFDWQTQMDEKKLALSEEINSLRAFQAQAALERETRAARDARRIEEDTLAVERKDAELRDSKILPGSPQYGQIMTETLTRHPNTKPSYAELILKQGNVEITPDELQRQWTAMGRKPFISETIHPDGRRSLTVRDAPEPKVATAPVAKVRIVDPMTEHRRLDTAFKDAQRMAADAAKNHDEIMQRHYSDQAEKLRRDIAAFGTRPPQGMGDLKMSESQMSESQVSNEPIAKTPEARLSELFGGG